jgi:DNA helicase-2/ATP-dependent DNA helicase PcrA
VTHPVVAEEIALLAEVSARLAALPEVDLSSEAALVQELEQLRAALIERAEEKDRVALLAQWNRHSALLQQLRRSRAAPGVDPASPYFAHLRIREGERIQDLCLGKATRIDGGVRIVDWRNAPISRLFYRYAQGEDYEEEVAGRLRSGTVLARRVVTIRDRALERVDAPEGTFDADAAAPEGWRRVRRGRPRLSGGEGAALRAHGSESARTRRFGTGADGSPMRADKRLPDIAGLIDPAQFDLIARPDPGLLVVRGVAGSGKTTVALHRVAYLAFDDPAVDSERTLVVAFSPALRDYVSHVLPALGVHHVQVRTFHDWAAEQVGRLFPALPRARREHAPASVQRMKLHPALQGALEAQVRRVPGPASVAQAIDDWVSVLTTEATLSEAFAGAEGFGPAVRRAALDWNRDRAEELHAFLAGDDEADASLDPEDDALLLRAFQLRVGALPLRSGRPLAYRHVTIDEVQDFAPVEVQVLLGCLDRQHSVTLAGDTQQRVMSEAGFGSWQELFQHLRLPATEVHTLRVSYRSTREITEFALALLGELREDEAPPAMPRSGPPVEPFQFTDHGACVAFLAEALRELAREEPLASVALLTSAPELSALYHRGLAESDVPRLRLVERQDFDFAPGVQVTEIEQVKGLEFDYVVLVDPSAQAFPDTPRGRRLLHMGATRAVHQLWIAHVGRPSPILSAASR